MNTIPLYCAAVSKESKYEKLGYEVFTKEKKSECLSVDTKYKRCLEQNLTINESHNKMLAIKYCPNNYNRKTYSLIFVINSSIFVTFGYICVPNSWCISLCYQSCERAQRYQYTNLNGLTGTFKQWSWYTLHFQRKCWRDSGAFTLVKPATVGGSTFTYDYFITFVK